MPSRCCGDARAVGVIASDKIQNVFSNSAAWFCVSIETSRGTFDGFFGLKAAGRPAQVYEVLDMFPISFSHFFRQWRAYDVNLCRLSRLDDRALALIGISRPDIARVAWERAQRTA